MKVLLTRPERDSQTLARALAKKGIESAIEPMLSIRPVPDAATILAPLLPGAQAVLFTSANGVDAFAAATKERGLPAFAVGDATARAARKAGFAPVESAGGNVGDLARLVVARLEPAKGALIHAAGSDRAGDLAGALAASGFEIRRAVLYRAEASAALAPTTRAALTAGAIDAALFFSPRSAQNFVRLAGDLRPALADVAAIAMSPAVAAALGDLPWQRIAVAASPDAPSLIAALEASFETERSA